MSESSTERVVSGTEKEEYTTGKVDKEGYTFKNTPFSEYVGFSLASCVFLNV
ncbi:hypothetical protein [Lactobacillus iners]|uniref:hypothetical protein n=1 Tax=Lactobacillus iners TaxID=147802 RepID=UPI0039A64BC3